MLDASTSPLRLDAHPECQQNKTKKMLLLSLIHLLCDILRVDEHVRDLLFSSGERIRVLRSIR
jgi:hypothetical protein